MIVSLKKNAKYKQTKNASTNTERNCGEILNTFESRISKFITLRRTEGSPMNVVLPLFHRNTFQCMWLITKLKIETSTRRNTRIENHVPKWRGRRCFRPSRSGWMRCRCPWSRVPCGRSLDVRGSRAPRRPASGRLPSSSSWTLKAKEASAWIEGVCRSSVPTSPGSCRSDALRCFSVPTP